jgi:glycosyltransferase involved in cell wall biosynthesis
MRRVWRAILFSLLALASPYTSNPFDDDPDNDLDPIHRRHVPSHSHDSTHSHDVSALYSDTESRLRIVHLDSGRDWRGGQNQVLLLMRELQKHGLRNALIAPRGPLLERATALGIPGISWRPHGDWDWPAAARVARALRASGASVVHCHDARSHALGVPAARLAGIPAIVVSRRVAFKVGTNPLSALKYRMPVDRYLCVSRGVIEGLHDAGVPDERLALVPDAFDLCPTQDVRDLHALLHLPPETPLIGTVAALTPEKGHADLLEAAARVARSDPEVHFVWMGEGKCRQSLLETAARLGLEARVHMLGYRADAQSLLRQCTLCVMASTHEGLGTALIEAQALGVPVIATAVGGVPDLIENGVTGRLVPAHDPAAMAAAILQALASPELRQRWAEAGRRSVREFDVESLANRTLAEYEAILRTQHATGQYS